MHNLAIALSIKGHHVTGSDDMINDPSKSRLKEYNLLPSKVGWFPERISKKIDAVILGMHAKKNNPELLKAKNNRIRIYSYPEFIFEMSKNKLRIVIGGSHGKTTITSIILHVLKEQKIQFDYLVGAQINGFDLMVKLTENAKYIILEGDEYLSSAIDRRPKFHLYKPNIALISGISWDHINVFKTLEDYIHQFELFVKLIEKKGKLIYNSEDKIIKKLLIKNKNDIDFIPYKKIDYKIKEGITYLRNQDKYYPLKIFGNHNIENISAAFNVCKLLGIHSEKFLESVSSFEGAKNRLELLYKSNDSIIFKDFAHSPSKVKATVNSVKIQYPNKILIACLELHTYSSLDPIFLVKYKDTLSSADQCIVCYSEQNMRIKQMKPIDTNLILKSFNHKNLVVAKSHDDFEKLIFSLNLSNSVLLMMSSGKFGKLNYSKLKKLIC